VRFRKLNHTRRGRGAQRPGPRAEDLAAVDRQHDRDRRRAGRSAPADGGAAAAISTRPAGRGSARLPISSIIAIGDDLAAQCQPPAAGPPRAAPGPPAENLARPPAGSMITIGDELAAQHQPPAARLPRASPGPDGREISPSCRPAQNQDRQLCRSTTVTERRR
jgi:hypothetical protein